MKNKWEIYPKFVWRLAIKLGRAVEPEAITTEFLTQVLYTEGIRKIHLKHHNGTLVIYAFTKEEAELETLQAMGFKAAKDQNSEQDIPQGFFKRTSSNILPRELPRAHDIFIVSKDYIILTPLPSKR